MLIKSAYGLNDEQVAENTALPGLMGQSENSTMQSLYIVAAFLVILVLIALIHDKNPPDIIVPSLPPLWGEGCYTVG